MRLIETIHGNVIISDDKNLLDVGYVHNYLHNKSYWAEKIPFTVVEKSIRNSLCFGLYLHQQQMGFARVITDNATFGYLADVFIDERYRGLGLSKRLMEMIITHPDLQGFRSWLLATRDAHGLYSQFGFKPLSAPERYMRLHNPDVYKHMTV